MALYTRNYEFETMVSIDEVVATAYEIGGLEVKPTLKYETTIFIDEHGKRIYLSECEMTKKEIAEALQKDLAYKNYHWELCFKHKAIRQCVSLEIDDVTKEIRLGGDTSLTESGGTLHYLICKTLETLGGIEPFLKERGDNQISEQEEGTAIYNTFPINVNEFVKNEIKSTNVFYLLLPFILIIGFVMFVICTIMSIIEWTFYYKYYLIALFITLFVAVHCYMAFG